MFVWFMSLGGIGIYNVAVSAASGEAWSAFDPSHAVDLFARRAGDAWFALGSVVLAITGVEAMFADLARAVWSSSVLSSCRQSVSAAQGHFGVGPIRFSWFLIAFPALVRHRRRRRCRLRQRDSR